MPVVKVLNRLMSGTKERGKKVYGNQDISIPLQLNRFYSHFAHISTPDSYYQRSIRNGMYHGRQF